MSHPIIRWLPSKLDAWIGDNYGQELGIPPMRGQKWTAGELSATLWSQTAEAPVSCKHLVALGGRVSSSAADQRHVTIPWISLIIASGERPTRSASIGYLHDITYDIIHDIIIFVV